MLHLKNHHQSVLIKIFLSLILSLPKQSLMELKNIKKSGRKKMLKMKSDSLPMNRNRQIKPSPLQQMQMSKLFYLTFRVKKEETVVKHEEKTSPKKQPVVVIPPVKPE